MMDMGMTRRDMLVKGMPAMAALGMGLGGLKAFAQVGTPPGPGGEASGGSDAVMERLVAQAYQDGKYTLPPLPYDYAALEPAIDEQTMRLHHDIHHQGYVDGLNKALEQAAELASGGGEIDAAKLYAVERNISFNGGGHIMHTIFWGAMSPDGGGSPSGDLSQAINRQFGSFDNFKKYYSAVAGGVKGSGWALLAYEPLGDSLMVFSMNEHDTHLMANTHPLLPLDVWEHAYYLNYQNKRKEYIDKWWSVVNWTAVGRSYDWFRSRYQDKE